MPLSPARFLTLSLIGLVVLAQPAVAKGEPAVSLSPSPGTILLAQTSVDEMTVGMRRAYILGIQEELADKGYRVGAIDGIVGKRTKGAIRLYQRDAGLSIDGIPTKELLDHMKFSLPKITARIGGATAPAHGSELVIDVQTALQERGYYQGRLDGIVGPLTRGAIRGFQQDAGLEQTGNVGSGVLNDLRAADPSIRRN